MYALAVFFSPRYGVISTLVRNARTSLRIVREDLLAMLYRVEELGSQQQLESHTAIEAVGDGMLARWGLASLLRDGLIERPADRLTLTDTGRDAARQLVRTHRLWESYLVQHLGLPLDHVHDPAHRVEHFIDEKMQRDLEEAVEGVARDPHGRDIPE